MAGLVSRIIDAVANRPPQMEALPAPAMRDGVINGYTGLGSTIDAHAHSRYFHRRLTQIEIDQAYGGSLWMRKLIDLPAKEQVRARRDWQADKPTISKLEKEEKRLGLWAKVKKAESLRGRGGGAIVIWIEGDDQTAPLDPARLRLGAIKSLSVWKRWQLTLGEKIFDLSSEYHDQPEYFEIDSLTLITERIGVRSSGPVRLHPSRVVCFRGEEVADGMGGVSWEDEFWGASKVEIALQAVLNADTAQNSFAGLIKDAVNVIIGIPGMTDMMATADGEAILTARTNAVAFGKSMWRAIFYDSGKNGQDAEKVDYRQVNWAGIPDVLMVFIYPVAASGNMPATIMLGKSPDGMNATGKGDLDVWEREIDSRREVDNRPCLEQIDVALIPSALGAANDDVWWEYGALSTPSAKEQADTAYAKAQAIAIYADRNLLNSVAFEKGIANMIIEDRLLPGFDDALDDIAEDERYPSLAAPDPNEQDPSALQAPGTVDPAKGGDPRLAGGAGSNGSAPARRAVNDASPRTLYVSRKVQNVDEIAAWAKAQGITDLNDDLHVTIAYSMDPVDWIKMGATWDGDAKGDLTINPGGPRVVEPLGKMTAVLMFASSDLSWRNMSMRDAGASWDWPDYQPHVSLTEAPVDLSKLQPYTGKIVLGPEIFEEIRQGDAD